VLKKLITGLQSFDAAISAPGFRAGVTAGVTVTAATGIILWVVL
jgi:hypothetical protein